jgi:glycosyltransferase involved in cell wall biosynthesis
LAKNALLVVDPDFTQTHVGVRRVIQFVGTELQRLDFDVKFATILDGELRAMRGVLNLDQLFQAPVKSPVTKLSGVSNWTQLVVGAESKSSQSTKARWADTELDLRGFEVSIVTNPWILANKGKHVKKYKFTHGFVLDLVPNLLAKGNLLFEKWVDAFAFAAEHKQGFEYLIGSGTQILTISKSTANDFESYAPVLAKIPQIVVPFAIDTSKCENRTGKSETLRVLMVNALDHRKNFLVASKALEIAARSIPIELTIVGKERVDSHELFPFLDSARDFCQKFTWNRDASDAEVEILRHNSDVLFFPSKYEGLGLPILEAESCGLPVISDSVSSCGEFNLNQDLIVPSATAESFAQKLVDLQLGRLQVTRGSGLVRLLSDKLRKYKTLAQVMSS